MRTPLRNKSNAPIGYLEDAGNMIRIYDQRNVFKGQYNKTIDTTYNASNVYVGKGNLLTMLLTD